jgi:hypothetical protein
LDIQTKGAIVLGMSFEPWEKPVKHPVKTWMALNRRNVCGSSARCRSGNSHLRKPGGANGKVQDYKINFYYVYRIQVSALCDDGAFLL